MLNLFQHLLKFRRLTASSSASLRLRGHARNDGSVTKGVFRSPP